MKLYFKVFLKLESQESAHSSEIPELLTSSVSIETNSTSTDVALAVSSNWFISSLGNFLERSNFSTAP
jgi:hypothetical protein